MTPRWLLDTVLIKQPDAERSRPLALLFPGREEQVHFGPSVKADRKAVVFQNAMNRANAGKPCGIVVVIATL